MPLRAVKTLTGNLVVIPGYGPVQAINTTVNITVDAYNQISATAFSGGTLQDIGPVPDPSDAVVSQAPLVVAPAALTAPATVNATTYTNTEVQAIRNDVANLRGTVAALQAALVGIGKPMSPT